MPPVQSDSQGFTLIELMVSMGIGLIILLGMTLMFTSNTKVSNSLASRTESLGDLYLVSQVMQSELRNAQAGTISWSSNVLSYTNQDAQPGYFKYQHISPDRLYWKRPPTTTDPTPTYQEVVREMDTTAGMAVSSSASGVWTVTLKSTYQDENHDVKTLDLSFKAWARN